jgi:chemotaxis family two-component system sensor kinase Cph1
MSDAFVMPADLEVCAREPIHIPGSIQPHGYLFVLNDTDLTVIAVSKNAASALGLAPAALIGRPIADLLVSTTTAALDAALRSPRNETAIRVRFLRST